MKRIYLIAILFLLAVNLSAQGSIVKQKRKLNEIAIIGTFPIFTFYNHSSQKQIVLNALNDDNILNDPLKMGYTDTSKATKVLRPIDFYGGNSLGGSIGIRVLFNIENNLKNKSAIFIPLTILYETRNYSDYYIGKYETKRIDTLNVPNETVYLDSISVKASKFRFDSESIFVQSGLNVESSKRNFKFSAGLNIGLGIGFRNKLYIEHIEHSAIQASNLDSKYFQEIHYSSEDKIQKTKPIVTMRLLVPFCMKLNFRENGHLGLMAEMAPGFEINQIVKGNLITRGLVFCSVGARYRFF